MTILKMTTYRMPAADLGMENPNPDLNNGGRDVHSAYRATDAITDEEKQNLGKGMVKTILPYTFRDCYNRERNIKDIPAIEMENDYLRAIFLPTLGGRLWSLFDKKKNRELLYVNSAFQPANLAIRNAWFSGGVEWNFCVVGHSPLTCEPLFVEFAETENGEPVLRMYEYERIRGTVISVEAYLPSDEGVLYFRNGIENTSPDEKYGYWWSNIAVPETKGTRVIVPSDEAFMCSYEDGEYILDKSSIPYSNDADLSYPINSYNSVDFFYKIPQERAHWIAAVDKDGKGLLQFSQNMLKSRKMFLWGQCPGGKRWAEFLSNPGEIYIEIQAGVGNTQLEHIPMKAGESWSWVEAYCATDCDSKKVHGKWMDAQSEVENQLAKIIGINKAQLENINSILEDRFPKVLKNNRIVQNGSGWGYLENQMRVRNNQPLITERFCFPADSVTEKETEWLELLNTGEFVSKDITEIPQSYIISKDWLGIAENSTRNSDNWYAWLQLGVMYFANDMVTKSKTAFEKSISCCENIWAYRNLAVLAKQSGSIDEAVFFAKKSLEADGFERGLTVNCAQIMTDIGAYDEWLKVFETLPQNIKADGRILLYTAISYVRTNQAEKAAEIINTNYVLSDIKEGEESLTHLWFEMQEALTGEKRCSIPYELDFRMKG